MVSIKLFVSKQIVVNDSIVSGGILVSDQGKIIKLLTETECKETKGIEIEDEGDLVIMSGIIDSHVHVNEPGRTAWEGFETATKAAAAGGITTIVDMPLNSIPPTTTLANFQTKVNAARNQIYVDVAFWGGVVPGNQGELLSMIQAGVVGFKCFMCPSGVDEFPHVNRHDIEEALKVLENTDSVLAFHAELEADNKEKISGDPHTYETFLKTRPPSMEINAITQIIELASKYKTRCHIVHLSTAEAVSMIKSAKTKGLKLTVETCHHYLSLNAEDVPQKSTQFKSCPPIRNSSNKEKLWAALTDGDIDMVVSDHSPSTPDLKLLTNCTNHEQIGDFLQAWGGISSVQFGLSLFWTAAKNRNFGIVDIGRYLSRPTAKLVGLHKSKGQIAPGFDADFVIWDPEARIELSENAIRHKNKITPYLGANLYGKVYKTIVRGQTVYELNKPIDSPKGKLLINVL